MLIKKKIGQLDSYERSEIWELLEDVIHHLSMDVRMQKLARVDAYLKRIAELKQILHSDLEVKKVPVKSS